MEGYFLGADGGTVYNVLGEKVRVLAPTEATCGVFEMFEVTAHRGEGPPPHRHDWSETMTILDGEIEVSIGAEKRIVRAGDFVALPAGTAHAYTVVSECARYIAVSAGPGSGNFFRDIDATITGPLESLEPVVAIAAAHEVALA
ncbi:cupin domain-containing protein [Sphingomonas sp. LB-2]|uniref:cupin domain-containing protein n=1 Tax=Sphingomonas caeni TaxID=2984949 RepID=UPI002230257C|nr:cupin domain-containing protein [Sphingomonas caeni]MCW3848047.1 cupin domain-containing protein [Sphingomonas caeni]